MRGQLTCVIITPYSLLKSRTGGIIGRLLSRSDGLEFVGARMYSPSDAFIERYLETLQYEDMSDFAVNALRAYVRQSLPVNNRFGITNRTLVLLFRGPNAVKQLNEKAIGAISPDVRGDTIRCTYGDLVTRQSSGDIEFFEPAVLAPTTPKANREQLQALADFAMSDGGILEHVVPFPEDAKPQTTLVIIKPDNFARQSARPGDIIDMFSRTGLFIVAAKLIRMTNEQAEEFYGPLRKVFVEKLVTPLAKRILEAVRPALEFDVTEAHALEMAAALAEANAEQEFSRIMDYMTGSDAPPWPNDASETGRCLALLYQGRNAIDRIRERLGATNPEKAEPGTVRSSYGHDLMKNGAHASDSPDNAERERRIVGLWEERDTCGFTEWIEAYLES